MSDILSDLQKKARDNARTPMQWDDSRNAGFSDGDKEVKPWMKVNDDYKIYNAERELADPNSVMRFWQKALKFRKSNLACVYSVFLQIEPESEELFIYTKTTDDDTFLVFLNFTKDTLQWEISSTYIKFERVIGNFDETALQDNSVQLKPYEGVVYRVD